MHWLFFPLINFSLIFLNTWVFSKYFCTENKVKKNLFCIDKNYLRLRIAIEEEPFYCRFHGVFSYSALSEKLRWAQQFVFVYRPVYTLACGLKNYWVFNIFERLKHFYLPSRFDFHSRALRPLSLSLSLSQRPVSSILLLYISF